MSLFSQVHRAFFGSASRVTRPGRGRHVTLRVEALEERALMTAGALDPTFGTGGKVTEASSAYAVALQADGKIVTAGAGHTVTRFNLDGSLDTSFGVGGKATIDLGSGDRALAVAIQPDGKILAAGQAFTAGPSSLLSDFSLVRYNANGSLDDGSQNDSTPADSFGTGGYTTVGFGSQDLYGEEARSIVLQTIGGQLKIVLGGFARMQATGDDFALARFNDNGTLDTSFDSDGKVLTNFTAARTKGRYVPPSYESIKGLALQGDGKIVAVGSSDGGGTLSDFALARYNTNGSLDTTFGTGGKVTTDFGSAPKKGVVAYPSEDTANGVAIQPDGKIVLAGTTYWSQNDAASLNFALARYNINGTLDTSFGTGGKVTTDFGGRDVANGIAIQTIGGQLKIVVGGYAGSDTDHAFALARYNLNGTLDTTFDGDGRVTTEFGLGYDEIRAIAVQDDGKIVAVGTAEIAGLNQLALARYESV